MRTYLIYKYTSPSKKSYIGQTYNESGRKKAHARKEWVFEDTTHFANAIRKHGFEKMQYEVLERGLSKEQADEREVYWISFYDCLNSGYNKESGGSRGIHHKHSDKTVEDVLYLLKNTSLSQTEICKKMEISSALLSQIKNGKQRNYSPVVRHNSQSQKGENNMTSKLRESDIKEIKNKIASGVTRRQLQSEYGVSKTLIQLVATEKIWSHVESGYSYSKKETNGNAKLTREIVAEIKREIRDGKLLLKEIYKKHNISRATLTQITSGKTWKDVE